MSRRLDEDFPTWHFKKDGRFTVRSAYHLAVMELLEKNGGVAISTRSDGDRPVWHMFWKIDVPQKMKICAWKLLQEGLPTRQVKKARHLEVSDQCWRCGRVAEDSFHAVVACPVAGAVWDAMGEV